MATCSSCAGEVAEGNRFCGSCGAAVHTPTSAPTASSLKSPPATTAHPASDRSRFLPGTVLAKRYRIVSLLGRGGMGEVYRADDLKLGQPVALKFLPAEVERDRARLDRFLNEVKTALKVTHPNVCRVHDIGEVDGPEAGPGQGLHYISMEYVDGEDMASLLRRIGRLPQDKAVQIARQLCAGLQAAHEEGILHRDLKPANIMIDGRGRAKITDFGLAGLAEGIEGDEVRAGTPTYMAPEQLAGESVTIRSDLYSLGLVLYELFTGKRAFDATTPAEMLRLERESTPSSPSDHVAGLDPAIARVILRCLESDSKVRPRSALAVAAALPGGDPLAAALAAGETPSPELVAAAGESGSLHPLLGGACLALIVVSIVVWAFGCERMTILRYASPDRHPQVLAERAREVLSELGYETAGKDTAYEFFEDSRYINHLLETTDAADRWEALRELRPGVMRFSYRQHDGTMVPYNPLRDITMWDPPRTARGNVTISLDMNGIVTSLEAVTPRIDETPREDVEIDWRSLLAPTGLDFDALEPMEPIYNPYIYCDTVAAWREANPARPDFPTFVVAGTYRGRLSLLGVSGPWIKASEFVGPAGWTRSLAWIFVLVALALLATAVVRALRNLRQGRGDRRGALRISVFLMTLGLLAWVVGADHVVGFPEVPRFLANLAWIISWGALAWAMYMALEPFVRRRWPSLLISWNRLLAGGLRDPLVGRHVLSGVLAGAVIAIVRGPVSLVVTQWLAWPPPVPHRYEFNGFLHFGRWVAQVVDATEFALVFTMGVALLLTAFRAALKKPWLATSAMFLLLVGTSTPDAGEPLPIHYAFSAFVTAALLFVLLRYGMLAVAAQLLTWFTLLSAPLTTDLSAWYAPGAWFLVAIPLVLAAYGFVVSLPRGRLVSPSGG